MLADARIRAGIDMDGATSVPIDIGADLSGARSLDITRAYVRAFFDQHLRSRPQALLDQPSPRFPEVMFCSP